MKQVKAAIVWLVVLYAVDALCFDGHYFAVAGQAIAQAYALNW